MQGQWEKRWLLARLFRGSLEEEYQCQHLMVQLDSREYVEVGKDGSEIGMRSRREWEKK